MTMEDYRPTKEEAYGVVERIQAGAADLRAQGASGGHPDADLQEWAAQKESAASAADKYAGELKAKLDAMQPGEHLAADVYRQADRVAKAAELGGILIDGRRLDQSASESSWDFGGHAKEAWEAGVSPGQVKAAEIEATGAFEHVAETIDGVEQVPFWRLSAEQLDPAGQDRGDVETTARVEEDAAERASLQAEEAAEVAAVDYGGPSGGIDMMSDEYIENHWNAMADVDDNGPGGDPSTGRASGPTATDLEDIASERARYAEIRQQHEADRAERGTLTPIPDELIGHRDLVYANEDGTVRHVEADVNGYDDGTAAAHAAGQVDDDADGM